MSKEKDPKYLSHEADRLFVMVCRLANVPYWKIGEEHPLTNVEKKRLQRFTRQLWYYGKNIEELSNWIGAHYKIQEK